MDVGFRILWWLDLDNQINIWNIEASWGHISSHKDLKLAFFKPFDGDFSLILRDVSMHDFHFLFDFLWQNQLIGILLCLGENNSLGITTVANKHVS